MWDLGYICLLGCMNGFFTERLSWHKLGVTAKKNENELAISNLVLLLVVCGL